MLNSTHQTRMPVQFFVELMESDFDDMTAPTIPPHCMSIPRVLLTPTRLALAGFETETSNRVVRTFVRTHGFQPTSFLRLQMTDEDGQPLFLQRDDKALIDSFRTKIHSGIYINGVNYEFLAYSSSQLKERSMWLVSPELDWTVSRIRESLGDFSKCTTPSKYAARIGQCFSTTFVGTFLQSHSNLRYRELDDIPSTIPDKLHSDGTGLIRREIMLELVKTVPNPPRDPTSVSALQIRDGGAKGVFTAWDFEDLPDSGRLQGFDVCLRYSMIKFVAAHGQLEICSLGKTSSYFLNRNVILLLSGLGVPDSVFIEMQQQMLRDLDDMLVDREKALYILPRLSVTVTTLRDIMCLMLQTGIEPSKDPFLLSCIC
jgi:RNA dependent RNA polymerase